MCSRPQDLEIEDFAAMSVRYDVIELCCALKPCDHWPPA